MGRTFLVALILAAMLAAVAPAPAQAHHMPVWYLVGRRIGLSVWAVIRGPFVTEKLCLRALDNIDTATKAWYTELQCDPVWLP